MQSFTCTVFKGVARGNLTPQCLCRASGKRTLAEHGDVPVRRSVHDCATRENPHRLSFTCTVFKGEQDSWGAESAIAPRLAAARMALLAENPSGSPLHKLPFFRVIPCHCQSLPYDFLGRGDRKVIDKWELLGGKLKEFRINMGEIDFEFVTN